MSDETLDIVAWIAVFLIGGGISIGALALYEAISEWRIARRIGNGRYLYAKATLRSQALRAGNLIALGAVALVALSDIESPRLVTVPLFMYLILSNSSDAVLDFITTRKMLAYYQDKLNRERKP